MKRVLGVRKGFESLFRLRAEVVALFIKCEDDDPYKNVDMTADPSGKTTRDVNDR